MQKKRPMWDTRETLGIPKVQIRFQDSSRSWSLAKIIKDREALGSRARTKSVWVSIYLVINVDGEPVNEGKLQTI